MTELTEDEIAKLWNSNAGIRGGWTYESVGCKEQLRLTLQDAIAKYAQPSEREIIERERQAWDIACCYHFVTSTAAAAERDRQYPLPKEEPAPVLTDHDINQLWDGNIIPRGYFDLTRKIERAVLAKLAEQKP